MKVWWQGWSARTRLGLTRLHGESSYAQGLLEPTDWALSLGVIVFVFPRRGR